MAPGGKLCERIEAVLRQLPLLTDIPKEELEGRIALAFDDLTRWAIITLSFLPDPEAEQLHDDPDRRPKVGRRIAAKELQKLAVNLETVIHALTFMPEPIATALAEAGLISEKAQPALEAMLRSVYAAFSSFVPKEPGRPRSPSTQLQQILIDHLGAAYLGLTGKRPTIVTKDGKASGSFYMFVEEMLKAMQLQKIIKPERAVRQMCRRYGQNPPNCG
jgi:hypothetical protein